MSHFTPFPSDCFPSFVQKFVVDQSKAIGCDESFVALPALSVLSSAIGAARRIVLKRTWSEPAVLWTALVGESGSGTTPALNAALEPLQEGELVAVQEASSVPHSEFRAPRSQNLDETSPPRAAAQPQEYSEELKQLFDREWRAHKSAQEARTQAPR